MKKCVDELLAAEIKYAAGLLLQSVRKTALKLGMTHSELDSMMRAKSCTPPEVVEAMSALLTKTAKDAKAFLKDGHKRSALEIRNELELTDAYGAEVSGLWELFAKKNPNITPREAKKLAASRFRYAIQSRSGQESAEVKLFIRNTLEQLEWRANEMQKLAVKLKHTYLPA